MFPRPKIHSLSFSTDIGVESRQCILHLLYKLWNVTRNDRDRVTRARADRSCPTREKSRTKPSDFLDLSLPPSLFAFDTYVSFFLSFSRTQEQTKQWVECHRRVRGLPSSAQLRVGGMPWMHPTLSHTVPPSLFLSFGGSCIAGRTSFCFLEKIKIPPA